VRFESGLRCKQTLALRRGQSLGLMLASEAVLGMIVASTAVVDFGWGAWAGSCAAAARWPFVVCGAALPGRYKTSTCRFLCGPRLHHVRATNLSEAGRTERTQHRSSKPKSQNRSTRHAIAPRRSPVRVRLAPSPCLPGHWLTTKVSGTNPGALRCSQPRTPVGIPETNHERPPSRIERESECGDRSRRSAPRTRHLTSTSSV
jgi:hypothetical protein